MTIYPVLVSIPHGGKKVPKELTDFTCLSEPGIFDDSDAFTKEIFDISANALKIVSTDIARAFVDVNRAADDRPPENPDGVVKSKTCYGHQIYKKLPLDEKLIESLLQCYYYPYHNLIATALKNLEIELALDCHSMASIGPPISPDFGKQRPAICLSNFYGKSCSMTVIEKFARCIRKTFFLGDNEVSINTPFSGGYITQTYGMRPIPWIQIDMNRNFYLSDQWFDWKAYSIMYERLNELKIKFEEALAMFFI